MNAIDYLHAALMTKLHAHVMQMHFFVQIESSQTPQTLHGIKPGEKRKKTVLTINALEYSGQL